MNRYERYKDSGIPWLVEVPEHWEVKRLKFITNRIVDGAHFTPTYVNEGIPFLRVTDIQEKNIDMEKIKYIPLEEHQELIKRCNPQKGDILLSKNGTIGISKTINWNWEFSIFVSLCLIKFNSLISSHYAKYFFDSHSLQEQIFGLIKKNTVINLHLDKIENFWFVLPSKKEQIAIAQYLDTKLGEIDALIDKQQTLLEKLAEQRTAVITHAVTKGLNPAAPMKNSGAEWLGEVPAHWETWKITHAIDLIGSGTTPKSDNAEYYDGDILWITTSELRENFISDTKQKVSDSAIKEYSALKIYPVNSVAMAMYGATIGRLGILEREATFNQACCVFGNSKILHYKFLFYWLWHRRPILISLSNGGGQPNLSQDDLRKLKIPIPSYEEQINIAEYLDQETVKIDRLCETVNQTIGRLKEYRTALITQVVTGKIKVTDE